MEVAPLPSHHLVRPLVEPQFQPAPKLHRQPSLKQVEYFYAVPSANAHPSQESECEPAVPKTLRSLVRRRLTRRVGRALVTAFNVLSQLDEEESVDEHGFIYVYDERVEKMVRPAEERRWMVEASEAGWTLQFSCNDAEEAHRQGGRLGLPHNF